MHDDLVGSSAGLKDQLDAHAASASDLQRALDEANARQGNDWGGGRGEETSIICLGIRILCGLELISLYLLISFIIASLHHMIS